MHTRNYHENIEELLRAATDGITDSTQRRERVLEALDFIKSELLKIEYKEEIDDLINARIVREKWDRQKAKEVLEEFRRLKGTL